MRQGKNPLEWCMGPLAGEEVERLSALLREQRDSSHTDHVRSVRKVGWIIPVMTRQLL
jgi:hypothetical protein